MPGCLWTSTIADQGGRPKVTEFDDNNLPSVKILKPDRSSLLVNGPE